MWIFSVDSDSIIMDSVYFDYNTDMLFLSMDYSVRLLEDLLRRRIEGGLLMEASHLMPWILYLRNLQAEIRGLIRNLPRIGREGKGGGAASGGRGGNGGGRGGGG